jgi:rhamnosyltransferase
VNKNNSVATVIVTHKTKRDDIEKLLNIISTQVGDVFVVDNGSGSETIKFLSDNPTVNFIQSSENNLAKAQNKGIKAALNNGFAFVLLLDDDSIPSTNMVYELMHGMGVFSIVGPCAKPIETGVRQKFWIISSGSLIRKTVFDSIGFMDEEMGIDMVDMDFCTRARSAGFLIAEVNTVMIHEEGQLKWSRFGAYKSYDAERYFTRARNKRNYIDKYRKQYPYQSFYVAASVIKDVLKIFLFEENRKEKWTSYKSGFDLRANFALHF